MKRLKKTVIITLIVLAILAAALFAAYEIGLRIAADKAVNTIIKNELNSMLDSGELTLDELIEIAGTEEKIEETELTEVEKEVAPEAEKAPQVGTLQTQKPVQPKPAVTTEEKKQEAIEKAAEKTKDEISASDKREVMKLIRSNLTTEDMKFLLSALKGGVTKKEISQAAKIAYARFDSEEIVRVKEFWHKYKNTIKRA